LQLEVRFALVVRIMLSAQARTFRPSARLSSSNNASSTSSSHSFCSANKVIALVLISWLILTAFTYYKVYHVSAPSSTPNSAQIPQIHGDALQLYKHLSEKIKHKEASLEQMGIDLKAISNLKEKLNVNHISEVIEHANKLKQQTPSPTPKPTTTTTTTTTTKKPDDFPKYFDTNKEDSTLHDIEWIRDRMYYWKKGVEKHQNKAARQPSGQYMTFWSDCGGFNNIRMGFEYMVLVAYLTNRTLVMPPNEGWYLIDWGQRSRMHSDDSSGKTGYAEFFDFDHLNLEVQTMETEQFVQEMTDKLDIDSKYAAKGYFASGIRDWRKYLNGLADTADVNMPWGPLAHILNWPSIEAVQRSDHKPDNMFISNRDNIEYTERQQQLPWIHFPSCDKGDPGTSRDYRYLGQVASFVWFDAAEKDNDLKRMLRDHVHLKDEVMFYASYIVQKLGAFQYAALHIRRNELQYKQSFIAAEQSLKHIKPLLKEKEVLYIATDEKDPKFFEMMEKEYIVYKWRDFVEKDGKMYLGDDIEMPRKYEGVIEMAVCGMARIFFGTDTSTFTSYITRLRGYFDAPDTSTYHHNEQWSGDLKRDSQKHHKLWGQTYMDEFPEMWENIKGSY